jgi:hypothetical protein
MDAGSSEGASPGDAASYVSASDAAGPSDAMAAPDCPPPMMMMPPPGPMVPSQDLCSPYANPDAGLATGSGINPDYAVVCDPNLLLCVLAKEPPSLNQ